MKYVKILLDFKMNLIQIRIKFNSICSSDQFKFNFIWFYCNQIWNMSKFYSISISFAVQMNSNSISVDSIAIRFEIRPNSIAFYKCHHIWCWSDQVNCIFDRMLNWLQTLSSKATSSPHCHRFIYRFPALPFH